MRKTASITLRLTAAEQAQLHDRAAAANLSVSAYIRSCIFEAESLRTQVKEALTQMRANSAGRSGSEEEQTASIRRGRFQFFPHWRHRRAAES